MSRTDVHMPYWVKQTDPGWRHAFTEDHDHGRGACDLEHQNPHDWQATRCHIGDRYTGRNIHCGCRMCTGQFERKQDSRRARTKWRAARQALLAATHRDEPEYGDY